MRRAAAAEVDLDRVELPVASRPDRDEVDGAAADHALARQPPADLQRLDGDLRRVLRVGGEAAAEVGLAVRAAEHLVVGGEDVDLARGLIRSCALGLRRSSPSISSSTIPP